MHALSLPSTPATRFPAGSDEQLVASALQGEPSAFEAIMRRHNRLLFRAARGVVADDAEAQDVVQETYLRAFTRLQDFQGGASLGTWLARIAINLALDVLRRRGRSVPTDCAQDVDHEPSPEHMMSFSAPHSASPESAAARTELRALLQSAIEGLPPIYRSVFMLRAVQDMSVRRGVRIAADDGHAGQRRTVFGPDHVHDALARVIQREVRDAAPRHVLAELQQPDLIQRP